MLNAPQWHNILVPRPTSSHPCEREALKLEAARPSNRQQGLLFGEQALQDKLYTKDDAAF